MPHQAAPVGAAGVTGDAAQQYQHTQALLSHVVEAAGVGIWEWVVRPPGQRCLHQLPVDTVKIDRSLVMHAETSDYHRVLIEATIRVAQTVGMDTVAEGIETESQAALMGRLACDRGQVYFWSRPLEVDALTAWLVRQGLRALAA